MAAELCIEDGATTSNINRPIGLSAKKEKDNSREAIFSFSR